MRISLASKLNVCGEKLSEWNNQSFGRVQKRIRALKKELISLKDGTRTVDSTKKEASIFGELDEWLSREELLWRQRGRMDWLKGGEHNTTFFKAKATQRKERKRVESLVNEDGVEVFQEDEVMAEFCKYFNNIFQSSLSVPAYTAEEYVKFRAIGSRISAEHDSKLLEP